MGEQPELDLAVIGADQHMPGGGAEGGTDAPAFLVADRNILQIRVDRGQPAGRGRGHREARMHPPGAGIDLLHQRIGVGGFELGELPPFQHAGGDIVPVIGKALQHLGIGAEGAGLHPPPARQLQCFEQNLAKLLGARDIEVAPRETVNILFHHRHPGGEFDGNAGQFLGIDQHPGLLHVEQDRAEAPIDLFIERQCLLVAQRAVQQVAQAKHDIGPFGDGVAEPIDRQRGEGNPAAAAAAESGQWRQWLGEVAFRQRLEIEAVAACLERIGHQHHIVLRRDRGGGEVPAHRLHIMQDFQHRAVRQQRGERGERGGVR